VTFDDGSLYERSFETPAGWVDVLAEVSVIGHRLELRDIAVYPRGAEHLEVAPAELLRWAHFLLTEVIEAGFQELRVTGTRLTGARPGRRVDLVIRLPRGQQP
jgi:hypothetical protein